VRVARKCRPTENGLSLHRRKGPAWDSSAGWWLSGALGWRLLALREWYRVCSWRRRRG